MNIYDYGVWYGVWCDGKEDFYTRDLNYWELYVDLCTKEGLNPTPIRLTNGDTRLMFLCQFHDFVSMKKQSVVK